MKTIVTFAFILFLGLEVINAQVGYTRNEIISKFGNTYYKTGISTIGEPYIIYKVQDTSATNGIYNKTMGFYFKKYEDGTEYCNEQFIMEPMSEINKWVQYLNTKFEKISKNEYKDNT